MTKTAATFALASLALLVLPATSTMANSDPSYNLAAQYDTDKNQLVSQMEIDAKRTEQHAAFDADKSGGLTEAEFTALWKSIHAAPLGSEFKDFDKDSDGKLNLAEWVEPMKMVVTQNDKSGDGFLSKDDLRKEIVPMPEILKQ